MMLYRNAKVKVCSSDGDTDYFGIIAGVLQEDTVSPYLFMICLDYVLRTSMDKIKENGYELRQKRSRKYPAQTITDADDADADFWQMHPPKPKPCYIIWNEPLQALASLSMHTRRNICALIKPATYPH